jgi:hypothetical protein
MTMTKAEFKERWDSNDEGGGITVNDIADCAKEWGLFITPRIVRMDIVTKAVVKASGATT